MLLNMVLAIVKVLAGIIGHSYALIADGIESVADIFGSLIVWSGLRVARRSADNAYPFGYGKAEALAAAAVGFMLLGAAIGISIEAVREIMTPHHTPAPFTLVVLVGVVLIKELFFRRVSRAAAASGSTAVRADAWHHRSDAITSLAAFIGISIALIGGPGWEQADDWAALLAACVIVYNGVQVVRPRAAGTHGSRPGRAAARAGRARGALGRPASWPPRSSRCAAPVPPTTLTSTCRPTPRSRCTRRTS